MSLQLDGTINVGDFEVTIELSIERGETVALVGPNGAGKSTVVRAIAGAARLTSGRLSLGGEVWDDPSSNRFVHARDRRVGVVFQQYLLFEHLSALGNVSFGLRAQGLSRREADRRARAALDLFGIADLVDQRPHSLSGGQAQRVALARAMVFDPDVLLLDEPLAALDASTRAQVRHDLAHRLGDVGAARLLVTHDPIDAHALADRVVVLEAGQVTQRGTVAELAAAPRSGYVADLMGTNLVPGRLVGHTLQLTSGGNLVVGPHAVADGDALAAIRPMAISLHRQQPEGSPRNVWRTRIAGIERFHDRVRVRLHDPIPVVVEVTEAGFAALSVVEGDLVWAAVKASEVTVFAAG